jgi:alkanesulfonate monooxygenase SsuD/methylene tetrahydromethanopterin reductase-like flavin-dependent oxidoreductase (luciferase family)
MKASFWSQTRYLGGLPRTGWPFPPQAYDASVGRRSFEAALELAELAEELGYDWLSFAEHHYTGARLTPSPLVMAAFVASRTRWAKIAVLGPIVSTQNPVRIAEEAAMLDNLSGGRLVLGLLRGTPNEYQVAGVNPAETRERTQEGIELLLKAWAEPQPFGWEGRYYRYRSVAVWPRPLQDPHPPVYALGTSFETAEFAARHHLGLGISYEPLEFAAEQSRYYVEQCNLHGWTPTSEHIVFRARIFVAESAGEAEELRRTLESRAVGEHHVPAAIRYAEEVEAKRRSRSHFGFGPFAHFVGTPSELIEQLRVAHEQVGIGVVDLAFEPPPGSELQDGLEQHARLLRSVELFGREVLPAMKEI